MTEKKPARYLNVNLPKTIQESFQAAMDDPEIESLTKELAIQRAMLARAIELLQDHVDSGDLKQFMEACTIMMALIKEIRETDTAIAAIEGKLKLHIDIRMFPTIINQMVGIIKTEVSDGRTLKRISEQLGSIPLDGSGGGARAAGKPRAGRRLLGGPAKV